MQQSSAAVFRDNVFDLMLGAGGFKAAAHVGVLQAVVERNIRIGKIYCLSAGSLIGTFFANSVPVHRLANTFRTEFNSFGKYLSTNLLRPSSMWSMLRGRGAVDLAPFFQTLIEQYKLSHVEQLCIVSSYKTGRTHQPFVFEGPSTNLLSALVASCAMPPYFKPLTMPIAGRQRSLLDAAVWNAAPIQLCKSPAIVSFLEPASRMPTTRLSVRDWCFHVSELLSRPFTRSFRTAGGDCRIDAGRNDVSMFAFDVPDSMFEAMILHGYRQACRAFDHLEKHGLQT